MHRAHQHNDIEISFLTRGWTTGVVAGRPHRMEPGVVSIFWAAYPHWSTGSDPETMNYMVSVPLDIFLRFRIPTTFKQRLLAGEFCTADSGDDLSLDVALFANWARLGAPADASQRQAMATMLEARLMALVPRCRPLASVRPPAKEKLETTQTSDARIRELLAILVRDFRQEISLSNLALDLGLHPSRASRLFHRFCGMTCSEFLTQCRLAHAQNLLLTTERKVLDVALDSGFPSISQFYAVFASHLGTTPQRFRQSLR